jgi:outer membrane biosynthesis protein TonB
MAVAIGSGQPVLDNYALALMRQAAPLPPIPDRMHIDRLNVLFPIVFMLKSRPEPGIRPAGQTVACN